MYSVPYHFLSIKSPASLSCAQYSLQQKGSAVFLQFILKEIYSGMVKTPPLNKTAEIQKVLFPQFSSGPGKDRLITLPQTWSKTWNSVILIIKAEGNYQLLAKHTLPVAEELWRALSWPAVPRACHGSKALPSPLDNLVAIRLTQH